MAGLLMLFAGAMLAWNPAAQAAGGASAPDLLLHALAIVGACAMWGLDNNLTRPISGGDPVMIAMLKGLAAGSANLMLAGVAGEAWPAGLPVAGALGYCRMLHFKCAGARTCSAWVAGGPIKDR